jgi:alpha-tubulin suppressor-like RCC1 family protein
MAVTFSGGGYAGVTINIIQPTPPGYYLWSWGYNSYGQIGDGTSGTGTHKSTPVQIGTQSNWLSIAAGSYHKISVKTDGTLWTWGYNPSGALGLSDTANRSSPVQVGALTNWSSNADSFDGGGFHTLAVKTDGTLWGWGNNYRGVLGLGDESNRLSPVQVGALTNWLKVSGGGYRTSLAIKTNNTLWTWGRGDYGRLGLGDTTNRSSPTQVGALTNWSTVSAGQYHMAAVKTDGTLWTAGSNFYGELGNGTSGNGTEKSSPVQVGSLTNWSSVSSGSYINLAVKTDGTLWSWGFNTQGQLGDGSTVDKSSPVQVGALTNWSRSSAGYSSAAIKTDGTIWTWGDAGFGVLGLGNTTNRSSPTQVGALNVWTTIFHTAYATAAIGYY